MCIRDRFNINISTVSYFYAFTYAAKWQISIAIASCSLAAAVGLIILLTVSYTHLDPVVGVSDLLIHLSGDQMSKKASEVIEGENLDVLIGSIPGPEKDENDKDIKDRVKTNILNILSKEYKVDEDDFLSAEIEVVPAGEARDYGLDRSMIMGYGHDRCV